jgi:rod shape-determining protein MreC
LQRTVQPAAGFFQRIGGSLRDFGQGLFSAKALSEENRRLKEQIAAMAIYDQNVLRLTTEAEGLRKLLSLPNYGKQRVSAEIIQYFPYEDRISLNVGSAQGISKGMPVVTGEGLLGLVKAVDRSSCNVLLLTAPSQKLGAIVINRNPPPAGLLHGNGDDGFTLEFQDPKVTVESGDIVTTAGYSTLIPRGLPIGRVLVKESDVEFGVLRAQVFPAVSIGKVREVIVLK